MNLSGASRRRNNANGFPRKGGRGFTLIELMIVVVVVAILSAIALPSYQRYIIRSNRTAAQSEMMTIANREEQYLLANRMYAGKTELPYALPSAVAQNYRYDIDVGSGTVPSFSITFTAIGSQTSDGNLTLTNTGEKTPVEKWKQ